MKAGVVGHPIHDDGCDSVEDGRHGTGVIPAFFRVRDVLRITALSRPTLYRRIAAGTFPAPVRLGGRVCAWSRVALEAWINDPDNYRAPRPSHGIVQRPRGRPRKYITA